MSNAVVKAPQDEVATFLEKYREGIAKALPRHLTADRMMRVALTEIRKNPKLLQCDKASLIASIIEGSQLGLEFGGSLGQAYLIPYGKTATFMTGFRGFIELARRSGRIQSISARCVYEKDQFEYEYGLDEKLVHKPFTGGEPGRMTYVYAVAKLKDGGHQMEVMTVADVEAVRDGLKFKNPIWANHFDEMARKTAIRRLAKYLPLSPEMTMAIENDDATDNENPIDHARQLGVFDADYVPGPFVTEDAVNVADLNKAAETKAADDRRADLIQRIIDAAEATKKPAPNYNDLVTMNDDQLATLLNLTRAK
jgi:recombination protein RecT